MTGRVVAATDLRRDQILWANFEKLVALMPAPARVAILQDLRWAEQQSMPAAFTLVADAIRTQLEADAPTVESLAELADLVHPCLFVYRGPAHCKGFRHQPTNDTPARVRIGTSSDPRRIEGQASNRHGLTASVGNLGDGGYAAKYVMGIKLDEGTLVPLMLGVQFFDLDAGSRDDDAPRYGGLFPSSPTQVVDEAVAAVAEEIERGHAWRLIRPEGSSDQPREATAQDLFETVIRIVARGRGVSVDPQADHGAGALDVCVSRGDDACCVELKLSSHDRLAKGFTRQLPTYMRSKGSTLGRYVVVCVDGGLTPDEVARKLAAEAAQGGLTIETVIIDGRSRPSASRL